MNSEAVLYSDFAKCGQLQERSKWVKKCARYFIGYSSNSIKMWWDT